MLRTHVSGFRAGVYAMEIHFWGLRSRAQCANEHESHKPGCCTCTVRPQRRQGGQVQGQASTCIAGSAHDNPAKTNDNHEDFALQSQVTSHYHDPIRSIERESESLPVQSTRKVVSHTTTRSSIALPLASGDRVHICICYE